MSIANYITFDSDTQDDTLYSSSGDIITPTGRGLAAAIQSALISAGLPASPPQQYSYYGWQMAVTEESRSFQLLLQAPGQWLLICEANSSWFMKLIRGNPNIAALTQRVANVLGRIPGIQSVRVQTPEEYTSSRRNACQVDS